MAKLWIRPLHPTAGEAHHDDFATIAVALAARGAAIERWAPAAAVAPGDPQELVLAAFADDVARISASGGFGAVDVISLGPDHPQAAALRAKFRAEHTHDDDEIRFFVAGSGLFCMRYDDVVLQVLCEAGELVRVPAGARHWFDAGPRPSFVAIRWLGGPDGWVPRYTGSDLADRLPTLDTV
jgi:1,2-dihydroxy-3-keto-5-methylthiopentene dioxygenase